MSEWKQARKKPIVIEYREVHPKIPVFDGFVTRSNDQNTTASSSEIRQAWGEEVQTHEGRLIAICGKDYIIKGVKGELYPIKKEIFAETYEMLNHKEKSLEEKTSE